MLVTHFLAKIYATTVLFLESLFKSKLHASGDISGSMIMVIMNLEPTQWRWYRCLCSIITNTNYPWLRNIFPINFLNLALGTIQDYFSYQVLHQKNSKRTPLFFGINFAKLGSKPYYWNENQRHLSRNNIAAKLKSESYLSWNKPSGQPWSMLSLLYHPLLRIPSRKQWYYL